MQQYSPKNIARKDQKMSKHFFLFVNLLFFPLSIKKKYVLYSTL